MEPVSKKTLSLFHLRSGNIGLESAKENNGFNTITTPGGQRPSDTGKGHWDFEVELVLKPTMQQFRASIIPEQFLTCSQAKSALWLRV